MRVEYKHVQQTRVAFKIYFKRTLHVKENHLHTSTSL